METTADMPVASRPPRACSAGKDEKLRVIVQLLVAAIVALPWLTWTLAAMMPVSVLEARALGTGCNDAAQHPEVLE